MTVLGLIIFDIYMLPLVSIVRKYGNNFHSVADDTQSYLSTKADRSR